MMQSSPKFFSNSFKSFFLCLGSQIAIFSIPNRVQKTASKTKQINPTLTSTSDYIQAELHGEKYL